MSAAKKKPPVPDSAKLETKAQPVPRDDARMNTAAYPQGTAPAEEEAEATDEG